MEQLYFEYEVKNSITKRGHAGVVASGDLEILVEPTINGVAEVHIRTQTEGFGEIWKTLFDRFFLAHGIIACIHINDFGATPGIVNLRLAQVMEAMDL